MRIYFISDIHIKSEATGCGPKLIEFLQTLPRDTTHLILLGDIFDIWMGPDIYYAKKYPTIVAELKKLRQRGIEIHYFEGNHDLHLKKYWCDKMDFVVHEDEFFFNFDGLVVRAEHGDMMNPDDTGYIRFRAFLRSLPLKLAITYGPGRLIDWIGERGSKSSRLYSDRHNKEYKENVIDFTRTHAQKVYNEKPFNLLITGHTHIDDDFTFKAKDGKNVRSVNLGSWLDKPKAFLITDNEQKMIIL